MVLGQYFTYVIIRASWISDDQNKQIITVGNPMVYIFSLTFGTSSIEIEERIHYIYIYI